MSSGRETISFRYLVIGNGSILFCADDIEQVERYIQDKSPKDIAVFQQKYVVEGVLCSVDYEDKSNGLVERIESDE